MQIKKQETALPWIAWIKLLFLNLPPFKFQICINTSNTDKGVLIPAQIQTLPMTLLYRNRAQVSGVSYLKKALLNCKQC